MFGQMESWDPIEQFIIVKNVVSPQFWKFKGLVLLYFAGVLTLCFTLKRKSDVMQELLANCPRFCFNREVPVVVDMHPYDALVFYLFSS